MGKLDTMQFSRYYKQAKRWEIGKESQRGQREPDRATPEANLINFYGYILPWNHEKVKKKSRENHVQTAQNVSAKIVHYTRTNVL